MHCHYHPTETGIKQCQRCGKEICSDCIKTFIEPYTATFFNFGGKGAENPNIYCPLCYWGRIIEITSSKKFLFVHIFAILGFTLFALVYILVFGDLFFAISQWLFLGAQIIFKIIPSAAILVLIYSLLIDAPRRKREAIEQKQEFTSVFKNE